MQWYYADEAGRQHLTDDTGLAELVARGQVAEATLVWNETLPDWRPCAEARPDLFGRGERPPPFTPAQLSEVGRTAVGAAPPAPVNAFAVLSLVFGSLGLVCCQIFGILGVVFGHIALTHAKLPESHSSTKGLAIAGLVVSYLSIVVALALLAFYIVAMAGVFTAEALGGYD